jgi:hypothetical protein
MKNYVFNAPKVTGFICSLSYRLCVILLKSSKHRMPMKLIKGPEKINTDKKISLYQVIHEFTPPLPYLTLV